MVGHAISSFLSNTHKSTNEMVEIFLTIITQTAEKQVMYLHFKLLKKRIKIGQK